MQLYVFLGLAMFIHLDNPLKWFEMTGAFDI
jgi:hypothetical protein